MPDFDEKELNSNIYKTNVNIMKDMFDPKKNNSLAEIFKSTPLNKDEGRTVGDLYNTSNISTKQLVVRIGDFFNTLSKPRDEYNSEKEYLEDKKVTNIYLDTFMDELKFRNDQYKAGNHEYNQDEGRMFDNIDNIIKMYDDGNKSVKDYFNAIGKSRFDEVTEAVKKKEDEFVKTQDELVNVTSQLKNDLGENKHRLYINGDVDSFDFQSIVGDPNMLSGELIAEGRDTLKGVRSVLPGKAKEEIDEIKASGEPDAAEQIKEKEADLKKNLYNLKTFEDNNQKVLDALDKVKPAVNKAVAASDDYMSIKANALAVRNKTEEQMRTDFIKNSSNSRNDIIDKLAATKKTFGDSKYFMAVKKEMAEFQKYEKTAGTKEFSEAKWEAQSEKLLKVLKEYQKQRDVGTSKKGTAVGQIRLDNVNLLIKNLEATKARVNEGYDCKELKNNTIDGRLEPKSQLEAVSVMEKGSGSGVYNLLNYNKKLEQLQKSEAKNNGPVAEKNEKANNQPQKQDLGMHK